MRIDDESQGTNETSEGPPEFEGGVPGGEAAPGAGSGGDGGPPRAAEPDTDEAEPHRD